MSKKVRALEPLGSLATLSAEVAEAGVWRDLVIKARAAEEGLHEQIRRRDMLIETMDTRWSVKLNEARDKYGERIHAVERERDEALAREKKAVEELEALREHTRGLLASLGDVKKAVAKKGAAKKEG